MLFFSISFVVLVWTFLVYAAGFIDGEYKTLQRMRKEEEI